MQIVCTRYEKGKRNRFAHFSPYDFYDGINCYFEVVSFHNLSRKLLFSFNVEIESY